MKSKWFGGNDAKTSASYFSGSKTHHDAEFKAVLVTLRVLVYEQHVELIYGDDEREEMVIA